MNLTLDSLDWSQLADAYGSAEEIPSLLNRLQLEDSEALEELFTRICHQGSVYSASFAAFPHLVRIAATISDINFRADVIGLAGAIYEGAHCSGYDDLAHLSALKDSTESALAMAMNLLPLLEDADACVYLWKSAAAFAGFIGPARILDGFVNKEFYLDCPNCEAELYNWPSENGMTTAAEDPVFKPQTERTNVDAGPISASPQFAAYNWLFEKAKSAPALTDVSGRLPYLFGTATCPSCRFRFSLMDALVEDAG